MIVKMKTQIGGYRNEQPWPPTGGLIELPDHEAADMIANGYAEEAPDAPAPRDDDPADTVDDQPDAGADDDDPADTVDDQPDAGADDDDPAASADQDEAPADEPVTDAAPADEPVTDAAPADEAPADDKPAGGRRGNRAR